MFDFEPAYTRFPIASLSQRNGAFAVDFGACFLLAVLVRELVGIPILGWVWFGGLWLLVRAVVPAGAGGQTLGRWFLSTRIVDMNYGKTSTLSALLLREGLALFACLLVFTSLDGNGFITSWTLFAPLPLTIDFAFMAADGPKRQCLRDRLAGTIVVCTRKGLDLDRKVGKALGWVSENGVALWRSRDARSADSRRTRSRPNWEEEPMDWQEPPPSRRRRSRRRY
ncbi:MAG: RDD family protein [Oscillatoriales cyanobacterium SM2_1_8]|nr:RDD family protein [Oscillatoriales cyanobacterium SM2_1_8]